MAGGKWTRSSKLPAKLVSQFGINMRGYTEALNCDTDCTTCLYSIEVFIRNGDKMEDPDHVELPCRNAQGNF